MGAKLCGRGVQFRRQCGIALLHAALFSLCVSGGASAGTITIDNFTQPNPGTTYFVPSGASPYLQISQVVGGVLGGQRDTLLHVIGNASPTAENAVIGHDTSFTPALDAFQLGTNGLSPGMATLQYSGLNALNTPTALVNAHGLGTGAGVDLTDGGLNNRFLIQAYSNDAQPSTGLDLLITITSPGGLSSTATATAQNLLAPFDLEIPFTQLVGNASISHVDSVTVKLNSVRLTNNVDYEIHGIFAVPEPAGIALMAIGCFAVLAGQQAGRRKQKLHRVFTCLPR